MFQIRVFSLVFLSFLTGFYYLHGVAASVRKPTNWDSEYWQFFNLKNWEKGKYKLYTTSEFRFNRNLSQLNYFRITENFACQFLPCLNGEFHYSFIYSKGITSGDQFSKQHRFEIETNNSVHLKSVQLQWRNRMEILKREDAAKIQKVFRHRFLIIIPLVGYSKWIAIKCSDEIFYNFNERRFNQNRFRPLELAYALSSKTTVSLFLMLTEIYTASTRKWHNSLIVGSELHF